MANPFLTYVQFSKKSSMFIYIQGPREEKPTLYFYKLFTLVVGFRLKFPINNKLLNFRLQIFCRSFANLNLFPGFFDCLFLIKLLFN